MKIKILILLFLAVAQFASAQKDPIPYEWFEEKSKTISDLQQRTGLAKSKYFSGEYIRFWENNFEISYSDKLATSYATMKKGDEELTLLIEDIDFVKAIGIIKENNAVYVYFPGNSLTLNKYGKSNSVEKRTYLDFYTNSKDESDKMFATLYELITLLKIDKGLMTEYEAQNHFREYQKLTPQEFYLKYPMSFLAYEGKEQIRMAKGQEEERLKKNQIFLLDLAKKYGGYVPNMKVDDFAKISPQHQKLVDKFRKAARRAVSGAYMNVKEGVRSINARQEMISEYGYQLGSGNKHVKNKIFDDLYEEIKNNIDSKYIEHDEEIVYGRGQVWIRVPGSVFKYVIIDYSGSWFQIRFVLE